jgi:hypothetical protein
MPLIECAYLGALPVDAFKIVFRISESDYEMRSVEVLGRSEKALLPSAPFRSKSRLKIQRAKVIVDNEGEKFLTTCESCDKEVYLPEGAMICEECKLGGKRQK